MKKSLGWREGISCCGQILPLFPDSSIPWASLMLYSLPVHAHLYTPSKPTPPTLVTVCLINYTLCISTLTGVVTPTPYTSLEESCTTITSKYSIVLPTRVVATHTAGDIVQDTTGGVTQILGLVFHFYIGVQGQIHTFSSH